MVNEFVVAKIAESALLGMDFLCRHRAATGEPENWSSRIEGKTGRVGRSKSATSERTWKSCLEVCNVSALTWIHHRMQGNESTFRQQPGRIYPRESKLVT